MIIQLATMLRQMPSITSEGVRVSHNTPTGFSSTAMAMKPENQR
jgi:hypothetical protein